MRHEKRVYSQNGEDGILEFWGKRAYPKTIVEIGCGSLKQCNSRYLAEKGWNATCIDKLPPPQTPPRMSYISAFVTAENVNDFVVPCGILSIDVDGNDYWIWKAIKARPTIVCIEYNALLGPTERLTVPYDTERVWDKSGNHGASIAALAALGGEKGYDLLGCESAGVNAFFILDEGNDHGLLPEHAFVPIKKKRPLDRSRFVEV